MNDRSEMGRVALITGGAGGIGLAAAQLFAARGWRTIATDRRKPGTLPAGVDFWSADLTNANDVETLVARVQQKVGRLDALVNNGAVQVVKPIQETTHADWDRTVRVNLQAAFRLSRGAYAMLKASRGAIVNVSSVNALATSRGLAAYAACKGGLLALTRAMALEFGGDGMRANAVLPGAVDTEMLRTGHEIAEVILFLADGERSSYVTGQGLVVDGGALAALSTE